jgi:cytochrome c oxidase assembly protein subunit 15
VAAVMRHSFAGLAISTFPWSTPEGGLLPAHWDFRVGIHFAHRLMAVVISVALVTLAIRIWKDSQASAGLQRVALLLLVMLGVQITLGAASVLTYRNAYYTTAHVIVGALTLATSFGLALWANRGRLDAPSRPAGRSGSAQRQHHAVRA